MSKKLYNYDASGHYLGFDDAAIDLLESEQQEQDIYLLAANATFVKPPKEKAGKVLKWSKDIWILENEKKEIEEKLSVEELFENAKNEKLGEIRIAKQQYQYSHIIYNDQEYLNTATSQNKFFNLVNNTTFQNKFLNLVNNTISGIDWILADGSWVLLGKEHILELSKLIILRENSTYREENRLLNLVNEAQKITDLEKINWGLK
jgi:hypothetical protein